MTDPEGHPRFEVRVTATDQFAWLRTRLAVERTIMAWLRTAFSLIGFGFAIVQIFERMQQMPGATPTARVARSIHGPVRLELSGATYPSLTSLHP